MLRNVGAFEQQQYDVAIIGGGITGACLALDAVSRGMSVALVEKGDFGAATSSASSKLLHGGIRYLQQGRLRKLRESAIERVHFQRLAPHLCRYVPFVVPSYRGFAKSRALLGTALAVYETLCIGQNRHVDDPAKRVPTGRLVGKKEIRALLAGPCGGAATREMTGGVLLYESHMRDAERMTLGVVKTAVRRGAVAANYVRAESFLTEGARVTGIGARDVLDGAPVEIRASMTVNAAGPWIPSNLDKLGAAHRREPRTGARIVRAFARGAHVVTKPLTEGHAVALPTREQNQALLNRGGRHIFIIPWRGHSLIGTTYGPYEGDPDEVAADESDVSELMELMNAAAGTRVLTRRDVVHAYAGLYPLTAEHIHPDVYQGTADYQIIDHDASEGLEGLVSVFGAKFTTARRLAEQAVDLIASKLDGTFGPCRTRRMRLAGGEIEDLDVYRENKINQYAAVLSAEAVHHLVNSYGTAIDRVVDLLEEQPALRARVSPARNVRAAEVVYAARHEMACRLEDVVFRRSSLGALGDPGAAALRRCATLMAQEKGWDEAKIRHEVRETSAKFLRRSFQEAEEESEVD